MTVKIDGTSITPWVQFRRGKISISGRSILVNSREFYQPLCDLLEDYTRCNGKITQVDLRFEYLNSSSTRCLAGMLEVLDKVYMEGNIFKINWYYPGDDESMLDMGQIMKSLTNIPFNFIEMSSSTQPVHN